MRIINMISDITKEKAMIRKNLARQSADNIYELIFTNGKYKPGDRLPGENILSEQLKVSRNTLREAIKILVSQGVLKVYRGRGTFVAEDAKAIDDYGLEQTDRIRLRLHDLYETRLLLEPELAALCCIRASDSEMKHIMELGKKAGEAIHTDLRATTEQEFHNAIIEAAHNEFLMQLSPIINNAIKDALYVGADIQSQLSELTLADHPVIMAFLEKRDPIGARQAMSIHLRRVINILDLNSGEFPII